MFRLSLERSTEEHDGASFYRGRIRLGDFEEEFLAAARLWKPDRYERQWQSAASDLARGASKAAFITSFVHPDATNVIWPAWREQDVVYVRNYLSLPEIRHGVLDPEHPEDQIGVRGPGAPEAPVSEWIVSLADVAAFAV